MGKREWRTAWTREQTKSTHTFLRIFSENKEQRGIDNGIAPCNNIKSVQRNSNIHAGMQRSGHILFRASLVRASLLFIYFIFFFILMPVAFAENKERAQNRANIEEIPRAGEVSNWSISYRTIDRWWCWTRMTTKSQRKSDIIMD